MKGEFAQFVKAHYDKVRDAPAKERLKRLAEMYRSGKPSDKSKSKVKGAGFAEDTVNRMMNLPHPQLNVFGGGLQGGGLLSDAFDSLGPINPFHYINPLELLGGGLAPRKGRRTQAPATPMNPVPPSVPVDRTYQPGTTVPGALYSGVAEDSPTELAAGRSRQLTKNISRREMDADLAQARIPPNYTAMHQIMGMMGMKMGRRGVPTKAQGAKIKAHLIKTHGKVKGGNLWDDISSGFSQGFKMPFQALGAVANAII